MLKEMRLQSRLMCVRIKGRVSSGQDPTQLNFQPVKGKGLNLSNKEKQQMLLKRADSILRGKLNLAALSSQIWL